MAEKAAGRWTGCVDDGAGRRRLRIGECLPTLIAGMRRVIHSRTCVMIVSDGCETGDARLLGREMAALAKRCRHIA